MTKMVAVLHVHRSPHLLPQLEHCLHYRWIQFSSSMKVATTTSRAGGCRTAADGVLQRVGETDNPQHVDGALCSHVASAVGGVCSVYAVLEKRERAPAVCRRCASRCPHPSRRSCCGMSWTWDPAPENVASSTTTTICTCWCVFI